MNRLLASSSVLVLWLVGCSSDSNGDKPATDAGTDSVTVADTAGQKNDGDPPKDLATDPPPASIGDAAGAPGDVPLDLSCIGTPMPNKTSEATDRTTKTAELGSSTLVPETDVEIFYSNKVEGTADVKGTSAPTTAELVAKIPSGFFATRTKKTGMIETVAYDWWLDKETSITFAIANPDSLVAIQTLAGGADYVHAAGTSRLVVVVNDCLRHSVSNAHVVIEVDGKIVKPVTSGPGIRRNYFGDNQLPSKAPVTARAGIVAFLGVPSATPVRLIAYGKTGGAVTPIAIRTLKPVPDGVVTALITPWNEP